MSAKKLFFRLMIGGILGAWVNPLLATIPEFSQAYMASNQPGANISPLSPIPPLQAPQKPEKMSEPLKIVKHPEKKMVKTDATYFHPGILILKDGKWDGGDYLYNLSDQLGVYVNILQPEGDSSGLDQNVILKGIVDQFIKSGIKYGNVIKEGNPPLPFFQIQILVYPFGSGYAACCKGALFEEVGLKRVNFEPGNVFQAITWQRESLIVTSSSTFYSQLDKSISETVNAFIERFQIYRELKSSSESYNE